MSENQNTTGLDQIKPMVVQQGRAPLLVGTPAYHGMMHLDCCKTFIESAVNGVQYMMYGIGNESLITRARNTISSYFYNHKEYSKLFFLDADIYCKGQDVMKLWNSEKDVIGAAVRLKSGQNIMNFNDQALPEFQKYWKEFETKKENKLKELKAMNLNEAAINSEMIIFQNAPENQWQPVMEGTLRKASWLGTAAIMYSRKAIECLVDIAKSEGRVYDGNSVMQGGDMGKETDYYYDIYRTGLSDKARARYLETMELVKQGKLSKPECGIYLSEDFWACQTLTDNGFNIWVDTSIQTVHNGMIAFDNFKQGV